MFMQKNCQKNYLDYLQQSLDRKSTRPNSSHLVISYAVFCLKKKMSRHRPERHQRLRNLILTFDAAGLILLCESSLTHTLRLECDPAPFAHHLVTCCYSDAVVRVCDCWTCVPW